MDVGSRLAARGKEAKREWRECLKAERARRFDDGMSLLSLPFLMSCSCAQWFGVACREYAAIKVVTEQDVVNRARKERKREARRQREYTV